MKRLKEAVSPFKAKKQHSAQLRRLEKHHETRDVKIQTIGVAREADEVSRAAAEHGQKSFPIIILSRRTIVMNHNNQSKSG